MYMLSFHMQLPRFEPFAISKYSIYSMNHRTKQSSFAVHLAPTSHLQISQFHSMTPLSLSNPMEVPLLAGSSLVSNQKYPNKLVMLLRYFPMVVGP
ncbi:MAG: hypothetical protein A2284_00745 [Deltaproteobacteria bacterium RIFOXYA12_FULL_61_11]|nr:MAG: hypothetical protein A2284_00745 [Deltaproteobacteria bacterium RIFOXYA12_FULL_61_11]